MTNSTTPYEQAFSRHISINAMPVMVWRALTEPDIMNAWMMPDKQIDIVTTWQEGSPFIMRGEWYKAGFENKGIVLRNVLHKELSYSHLSSLSRLEDKEENFSVIVFELLLKGDATELTVTLRNFPTETIYRHLALYWTVAITLLKKEAEQLS